MTELDLNRIRRLEQAATPGPWGHYPGSYVISKPLPVKVCQLKCHHVENENAIADSGFIAAAREDVPALVALCEELAGWTAAYIEMKDESCANGCICSFPGQEACTARAEAALASVRRLDE